MAVLQRGLLEEYIPVVKFEGIRSNKDITVGGAANTDLSGSTGTFKFPTGVVTGNDGVALVATFAEINRAADASTRLIAAGATLAVTEALHDGKIIKLDTAAGSICTLPAATGSGAVFRFVISVIATTNSHVVKVANASDIIQGVIVSESDNAADAAIAFATAATDDTITLNRTTTGSVVRGEWLELLDVATNLFLVRGVTSSNGTEATPFSATV